jgi:histone H2A
MDISVSGSITRAKFRRAAVLGGPRKKSVMRSIKAGLQLLVGCVRRYLKEHVGSGAPVYLAAILKYLTTIFKYLAAEVIELAGNAAKENKKSRIIPRHLLLPVRGDEELDKLFACVTILHGGMVPYIKQVLLPKKTA